MKWTAHIEGGPMRVNHAAVLVGKTIYSFGGYSSTDEFSDWQPIPVHALDTATMRWCKVHYTVREDDRESPFERYGHTVVAYGDKVYMWGGRNNSVQCELLACFDTYTNEWTYPQVTGQIPYVKDGHTACLIRNRMYIFGGFEYNTDQYSKDLYYLDLNTMIWKCVIYDGIYPSHRDFHTAVSVGDRMYVFGGRGDLNSPYNSLEEVYCPQLFYLDTVDHKWVDANPSGVWPEPRRSHSAWHHNGYMYIFGGYNGLLKMHFNDIWRYCISSNSWEYWAVCGKPPTKRRRQACVMHKNHMFMFGGTSPGVIVNPEENLEEAYDLTKGLIDNSDLHVLDFAPTLKTLAICSVLENGIPIHMLPKDILVDIKLMTAPNRISGRHPERYQPQSG